MSDNQGKISDGEAGETEVVIVPTADSPPKSPPYAVIILGIAVVVLLVMLVTMNLPGRGGESKADTVPADLAELRAELDARRAELNRERVAMGLSPLAGGSEPLDEIAGRLKKDSETLVSLAGRFQQMLAEKDAEISAKSSELLQSERTRQSLANEVSRLQTELQGAVTGGSDTELMRQELQLRREQNERLQADLQAARQELANLSAGNSFEDVEVLRRQLEETQRARDFFEKRVMELETPQEPEAAEPDEGLIDVEE